MKTKILNTGKEIETNIFSGIIREDISQKVYEAEKEYQPFAPTFMAGQTSSASGKIKKHRKAWKTGYGHGISRVPRKIVWRRGTQFNWIGAIVANTVGGRRAHPPKIAHFLNIGKINEKERKIALNSGIAASADKKYILKRYQTISDVKNDLPLILSSDSLKLKTDKFFEMLIKNLGELKNLAFKVNIKRAGKGKLKGNKYRKTAGLLLVIGNKEACKIQGIDIVKVNELQISDLYPLGRLAIYSEEAVKELGGKK